MGLLGICEGFVVYWEVDYKEGYPEDPFYLGNTATLPINIGKKWVVQEGKLDVRQSIPRLTGN